VTVSSSDDGGGGDLGSSPLYELYHENSKTSRFDRGLPAPAVIARMNEMIPSLSYDQYPLVELPVIGAQPLLSLEEAVLTRHSAASLAPVTVTLEQVATLLTFAYGVTRPNEGTIFPRPFRTVPSAGALYPLELYFHSIAVEDLTPGLYHYNPSRSTLRQLRARDLSDELAAALVQPNLAFDASVLFFITAAFERATFKYGERGYRFTLLEAGHVGQNIDLAANALHLGAINIGGFFDREVDDLLGLDGVAHSTLYMVAVGGELDDQLPLD
jgi:SagB-type dehydrogenase family enzyme